MTPRSWRLKDLSSAAVRGRVADTFSAAISHSTRYCLRLRKKPLRFSLKILTDIEYENTSFLLNSPPSVFGRLQASTTPRTSLPLRHMNRQRRLERENARRASDDGPSSLNCIATVTDDMPARPRTRRRPWLPRSTRGTLSTRPMSSTSITAAFTASNSTSACIATGRDERLRRPSRPSSSPMPTTAHPVFSCIVETIATTCVTPPPFLEPPKDDYRHFGDNSRRPLSATASTWPDRPKERQTMCSTAAPAMRYSRLGIDASVSSVSPHRRTLRRLVKHTSISLWPARSTLSSLQANRAGQCNQRICRMHSKYTCVMVAGAPSISGAIMLDMDVGAKRPDSSTHGRYGRDLGCSALSHTLAGTPSSSRPTSYDHRPFPQAQAQRYPPPPAMGNYLSKRRAAAAAKARSDEIDMQIEEESRKLRQECKVLLLGLGESGKTTIVKHMKIHHHGFTTEELIAYKPVIYNNLLDSAQALVLAMREIGVECVTLANRMNAERIVDYQLTPLLLSLTVMPQPATSANLAANFTLPASVVEAIHQLWNDQIIPAVMDRAESYLIDNAQYFLDNALRIGSAAYVPTESDVLCARAQKGTGITETRFEMGGLLIRIVEVGGQRSQLKKWIHCFESVTSIIFCTALSEYGQMLLEDRNKNRLVESLVLFESVINSRWFLRASIILFLNKLDVFKIKLQKVPLERYFPEYGGGPDVNKAAKYILWRFMQANRARLSVYPHMTQATDRDPGNSRLVFAAVKETILQNALKDEDIL